MNIIFKFKRWILIVLIIILNSFHPVIARPIEQPLIVFAFTDCEKAYLIRLFENGKVEYRGAYGVKTLGKRETQINQQSVKDLLNKLTSAGSFNVIDDQLRLPFLTDKARGGIKEAIYLRQNNKTAIFFRAGSIFFGSMKFEDTHVLFIKLRNEIFHTVNIDQWITYTDPAVCWDDDVIASDMLETSKLKFIKN